MSETRIGRVYGELKIIETVGNHRYRCVCSCGKESVVFFTHLRSGATKSCGHLRGTVRVSQMRTHSQQGVQSHPLYGTWRGIWKRCADTNHQAYHRYGGRGIGMHVEWQLDFFAFVADVGAKPSEAHTLDRYPNRNGNYEPGNVRWATPMEQAANSDSSLPVVVDGALMSSAQAARHLGLSQSAVAKQRGEGFTPTQALALAKLQKERWVAGLGPIRFKTRPAAELAARQKILELKITIPD